ncbi:MAG: alpha/beta hydrolase [Limisphaerales bacterium]
MVSGGWYSRWHDPKRINAIYWALLAKGFTVFSVRHGSSPKFTIPEVVGDVRRSVRFIRQHATEYGVDPKRLGVCGGSAGGHLSLVLGTTSDAGNPQGQGQGLARQQSGGGCGGLFSTDRSSSVGEGGVILLQEFSSFAVCRGQGRRFFACSPCQQG